MAVGDASTHTLEEQAEAHPLNSSFKSKQFRNRDNCIKISVSFDDWCQMPVVNERRADRHVRSCLEAAHLCIDLFDDVASYLVLSLYFNYVGSSPRLDQKVYLASALTKRRNGRLAKRCRRGQQNILQVKIWNQHPIVVNHSPCSDSSSLSRPMKLLPIFIPTILLCCVLSHIPTWKRHNKIAPFFDSKNWCYFSLLHHSAIAKPDRHSTILLSPCWFFPAWTKERFTMVPRAVPSFMSDFAAPVSAPDRKQPLRSPTQIIAV